MVAKSQAKKYATQQFLQTAAGKAASKTATQGFRMAVDTACRTQIGKTVVSKTATGLAAKPLYGAASRTVVTSAMKGNVIATGIGFGVNAIIDTVELVSGKQSEEEFKANMGKNAAEAGGSLAGSGLGAVVGSAICPGIGTVIGSFIGGLFGGMGARSLF